MEVSAHFLIKMENPESTHNADVKAKRPTKMTPNGMEIYIENILKEKNKTN